MPKRGERVMPHIFDAGARAAIEGGASFAGEASPGTKIVALTPSFLAAKATAAP